MFKKKKEEKMTPEWVKAIAEDKDARNTKGNDKDMLREAYLEYVREGMSPNKAMEKAKRTLACFKGGDKV